MTKSRGRTSAALSHEAHDLAVKLAAAEERTVKAIMERALAFYAEAHPLPTKRTKKGPK